MNVTRITHITAAIHIVRACGPVGQAEIAREIRTQCQYGTPENCQALAASAIDHGLGAGWLVRYDDIPDAYVISPKTGH